MHKKAGSLFCSCGATKRFEFQLIPTVISVLKCEDSKYTGVDNSSFSESLGMDWESVCIYTCSMDCKNICIEFCTVEY